LLLFLTATELSLLLLVGLWQLTPRNVPQPCRLIVLTLLWKFPLAPPGAPTSTMTWESASRERGNCGQEITGNFADNGDFCIIVGFFYMPKICGGRHAEDFFTLKNPMASAGFEPVNLGTRGQHATPRPRQPLELSHGGSTNKASEKTYT
jgi:hypothetical protein